MMQDKKALQAGTSHFWTEFLQILFDNVFKQGFSRRTGMDDLMGVSTRLVGGLIMTHSDDDGLVLPPAIAPHTL